MTGLRVTIGGYHVSSWRPERSDEQKAQKAGLREGFLSLRSRRLEERSAPASAQALRWKQQIFRAMSCDSGQHWKHRRLSYLWYQLGQVAMANYPLLCLASLFCDWMLGRTVERM